MTPTELQQLKEAIEHAQLSGFDNLVPVNRSVLITILRAAKDHLQQQSSENEDTAGLRDWLDTQTITSDNIGSIRRECFMPFDCKWNAIVREETAERENKPRQRGKI